MMGFVIMYIVGPFNLTRGVNSVTYAIVDIFMQEHVDLAMVGLDECNTCNDV